MVIDELIIWSLVAWHLPSIFTVLAFSFFAYFIAKLNIEIEDYTISNGSESFLPLMKRRKDNLPHQRDNRKNILIPSFFVFFNLLAIITFVIIVFSCKIVMVNLT